MQITIFGKKTDLLAQISLHHLLRADKIILVILFENFYTGRRGIDMHRGGIDQSRHFIESDKANPLIELQ